ncbi:MAG: LPS-assembly protein LptD [Hyphomicrobiaceae bacterium]
MRDGRPPHLVRGSLSAQLRRCHAATKRVGSAFALMLCLVALLVLVPTPTRAQDPSIISPSTSSSSSFPKPAGGILGGPVQKIDSSKPLYLQGDELIYDTKGNKVRARGNVEIFYNNYVLKADEVQYDQGAKTLTAVGNVELREPNGNIVRAERYKLTDDFRDGFIQSLSAVTKDDTRIVGERATRRDGNITEFEKGKFTPCKNEPGKPPLWCISAARITHDQSNATITYQDAWFEIFGQPVLYLPYFQHADPSVKRKSGFLMPEISSSTNLGMMVEIPYYFALAPNYDFTFHPMYTAKQGVLWQGDWRHKVSFGDINGEYLIKVAAIDQNDALGTTVSSNLSDNWRGSVHTKGQFSLSSWWKFGWDVTVESDDSFRRFYKLDNILQTDRVNSVYLRGQSERNYFSMTAYQFGGLLLSDTHQSESRVHPVVDWNYIVGQPVLGGELGFNVNAVSFSRGNGGGLLADNKLTGRTTEIERASADVNWRRRLTDQIGITYTPFANLRGDIFSVKDAMDPVTGTVIGSDTGARGVASAGVLAAYPWIANTAGASHVVEPIGQLIGRTARVSQRNLPDEDAKSLVFDDTNLFELDKSSGWDRIETGTRANVGLQYTFQARTGEMVRLLAGQSFHLSGDNIFRGPGTLADPLTAVAPQPIYNPNSGLETMRSDYVLGAYLAPSSMFRMIAQARFDERDMSLRRSDVMGEFNYGPLMAQANYTFSAADPTTAIAKDQQEIFGLLGLRLTDRWSVMGSMRFDIDTHEWLQEALQLRYADDCFVLTGTYTETRITDVSRDIVPDKTLMLRVEFKYLGDFRYKTNSLDSVFATNQPSK